MGRKQQFRTPRVTKRDRAREEKIAALAARHDAEARATYTPKPHQVKLDPKTVNQRTALRLLEEGRQVVFLIGSAGTGKSMLATYHASNMLREGVIKKVYLVRPAVSVGKSVGLLPGDIKEKLAPYFAQTLAHLERFLGTQYVENAQTREAIEMKPVEYLRGMSFENCIVIAEEVQNFSAEEMEMMLTRIGENCTIIFTGDTRQHDLRGESGLKTTIDLLNHVMNGHPEYMSHDDMDELDAGIGIVQFKPEDVVRSGITKAFVRLYYHN